MRYVHTNIVAEDWKKLADFYCRVFQCSILPPERDLKGDWLDKGTGITSVHIQGVHLVLPGFQKNGPTLEIFQYSTLSDGSPKALNRPGFAHIAFAVEDVPAVRDLILREGGNAIGELIRTVIPGKGSLEFIYMADPEGNIIELQAWS